MQRVKIAMLRHLTTQDNLTAIKTANRRKMQAAFSQALALIESFVSQNVILIRGCVTNKPSSPSISNAFSFNLFSWKNCYLDTKFEQYFERWLGKYVVTDFFEPTIIQEN